MSDHDGYEAAEAMERQRDRDEDERAELLALLKEAADALEGWVQSETQYANHEEDPSWKLAQRFRAAVASKEP